MNSILVVGLATVDLIYYLEKLPNKGIKYVSKKQIMSTGGNASNASIAISRLGGSVVFVSKIGNDFFGNYILTELKSENIKFVLLSFQSSVCPLPIKLDPSIRSLSYVNIHSTVSPFDLYDRFIGRILSAREIPVTIPAAFALYLHELFYRSQMCVCTIMDRLLLMFKTHFQFRKSVLCMWRDTEWLVNASEGLSDRRNHFDKSGQRHRLPEEGIYPILSYPILSSTCLSLLLLLPLISEIHFRNDQNWGGIHQ